MTSGRVYNLWFDMYFLYTWYTREWCNLICRIQTAEILGLIRFSPSSCIPRVQEVHIKPKVLYPIPGHLGLGVIFNTHAEEMYC